MLHRHPTLWRAALAAAPFMLAACGDSDPAAPVVNPFQVDTPALELGMSAPGEEQIRTVQVYNGGSEPFTVKATIAGGTAFVVDTAESGACLVSPIPAGGGCEVGIRFTGQTAGVQTAELHIGTGRRGEAPTMVTLAGTTGVMLQVNIAGTGDGIAAIPTGFDECAATCTLLVSPTSPLTLTATPAAGSYFAGWSGECTGTGPCTFTPAQGDVVSATFAKEPETSFTSAPLGATNATSVRWAFDSDVGTSFECSLNSSAFAPCTSPYTASNLTVGANHTFRVRAVDDNGHADPTPASSSTTITLDTPLLRYRFEGNAANSGAVGGYTGTATSVTYPAGRFGSAVKFDGTTATRVLFPGTAAVLGRGGPLTISLWYREDAVLTDTYLLDFRGAGAGTEGGWQTYHGAYGSNLASCSDGGCFSFAPGTLGAWHNLTYRYATPGGAVEFWVDGVHVGGIANVDGAALSGMPVRDLLIGNSHYGTRSAFYVDELRIYDTAFTPAEQCTRVIGGTWNGTSCTLP